MVSMSARVRAASLWLAAAAWLAGPMAANAQSATQYRVVELPPGFSGTAINAQGQVIGYELVLLQLGTRYDAFRIDGATGTVLAAHENSLFTSINAFGDSVGSKAGVGGVWKGDGGFVAMPPLPSFGASAINDAGHIAGTRITSTNYSDYEGVVLRNGALVALQRFGPRNMPRAINNKGQVVGDTWAEYADTRMAAYWREDGTGFLLPQTNSGGGTYATDINDKGTIVGGIDRGRTFAVSHALKWENGEVVDLTPGASYFSTAQAINNSGDIVGSIYDAQSTSSVLWTGGRQINLNDVVVGYEGHLSDSLDINDKGWILSLASKGDEWRTVVLIPIPEPGAIVMAIAGLGIVWLGGARRRALRL